MDSCYLFCYICTEIHKLSAAVTDGQIANFLFVLCIICINPQFYAASCRTAENFLGAGGSCRKCSRSLSSKIYILYLYAVSVMDIGDMDSPIFTFHMAIRLNSFFYAFPTIPFYFCPCNSFCFIPGIRIQCCNSVWPILCPVYQRNGTILIVRKFFHSYRTRKSPAS